MNLKLQSASQKKEATNLTNAEAYPTIADLINDQNITCKKSTSVHRRRDLDSFG